MPYLKDLIHRFQHIIDLKGRNRNSCQDLHFNACAADGPGFAFYNYARPSGNGFTKQIRV